MKFFTPELLAKQQDRSGKASFLAAHDEWERAVADYKKQLRKVHDKLPVDLQHLLDAVPLLDAQVLDMRWGGRSQFTITLHAQAAPSRLVVLTYSLVDGLHYSPRWRLFDLWNNIYVVGSVCLGLDDDVAKNPTHPPVLEASCVLGAACILCLIYLNQRIRAVEVVR